MDPAFANDLERFAVQREGHRDRVGAIRDVNDIVDDGHAVRVGNGADPPGLEVVAVAVEDHDWRVGTLKDVEAVLSIRRHRADHPKRLPSRELREVLDELVGIFACANCRHVDCPLRPL
jgi:hypothetical protein